MLAAKPVYFPEEGTDLEQVAMEFHAQRHHPSYKVALAISLPLSRWTSPPTVPGPVVGAPYHNPCIDDRGVVLNDGVRSATSSTATLTPN